jgi:hypothetical protein
MKLLSIAYAGTLVSFLLIDSGIASASGHAVAHYFS